MKKIAFILAVITAVLMLASCGDKKDNVVTEDVYIDVNTGKKIDKNGNPVNENKHEKIYDVTPGLADYDSEGKLIVKSTENRYVYLSELGYIIFSFNQKSDGCIQVLEVRSLEDEEKAAEYLKEHIVEMMSSGYYTNVNSAGNNVVFTVSLDNPIYGKYLKLTRADVEKDMPEEMKCN